MKKSLPKRGGSTPFLKISPLWCTAGVLSLCCLVVYIHNNNQPDNSFIFQGTPLDPNYSNQGQNTPDLIQLSDGTRVTITDQGFMHTPSVSGEYPEYFVNRIHNDGITPRELSNEQNIVNIGRVWLDTNATFGTWVQTEDGVATLEGLRNWWAFTKAITQMQGFIVSGHTNELALEEALRNLSTLLPPTLTRQEIDNIESYVVSINTHDHGNGIPHGEEGHICEEPTQSYADIVRQPNQLDLNENGIHDFEDDYLRLLRYIEHREFDDLGISIRTLEYLRSTLPVGASHHDSSRGMSYGLEYAHRSDLSAEEILIFHNASLSEKFHSLGVYLALIYQAPFEVHNVHAISSIVSISKAILEEGNSVTLELEHHGKNHNDLVAIWHAYMERYGTFLDNVVTQVTSPVKPPKEFFMQAIATSQEFSSEKTIRDDILANSTNPSNNLTPLQPSSLPYSERWVSNINIDRINFANFRLRFMYAATLIQGLEISEAMRYDLPRVEAMLSQFTPELTTAEIEDVLDFYRGLWTGEVEKQVNLSSSNSRISRINDSTVFNAHDSELIKIMALSAGSQEVNIETTADLILTTLHHLHDTVDALRVEDTPVYIDALLDRLADINRLTANMVLNTRWIFDRDPAYEVNKEALRQFSSSYYDRIFNILDRILLHDKPTNSEFQALLSEIQSLANHDEIHQALSLLINLD